MDGSKLSAWKKYRFLVERMLVGVVGFLVCLALLALGYPLAAILAAPVVLLLGEAVLERAPRGLPARRDGPERSGLAARRLTLGRRHPRRAHRP